MENASKALLIAGGVLIAILILTMAVFLFSTYGQLGETYQKNLSAGEIKKFNSNFIQFEGRNQVNGRANITAQEIVTLYKFVRAYNIENETDVNIKIEGVDLSELPSLTDKPVNVDEDEKKFVEFVKSNSNKDATDEYKIIYFECTNIEYDENTGMVNEITFTK